jgi:hypothetical protein
MLLFPEKKKKANNTIGIKAKIFPVTVIIYGVTKRNWLQRILFNRSG